MQKIVHQLWFDKEAVEAAHFYASVFPDSEVLHVSQLHGTPSGDVDTVSMRVCGLEIGMISAGPYFKPNPSISFMVNFDPSRDADAAARIDQVWAKLIEGGSVLMPLGDYPFSKRYGWVSDKYGFSWQLILTDPAGEPRPGIVPSLLFVQGKAGKAEEATDFYISAFDGAKRGMVARYPAGAEHDKEGTIMFTDFMLEGQWFAAMDSAHPAHAFDFNEALSFLVRCEDQAEIDRRWAALSAVPEAEQCGWLKDKFGVSWQIAPAAMEEMMKKGDPAALQRVTEAFLKMKKFDLAELERAYKGM